ncbi:MAG: bacillithiol biosynthesis cysteine-adding enzyme BshC [Acidobacteria bacterium]|nr:bacillithiol biosynthesis cysteine-adding enzyme BshC [Acidobacteriota bacterium]
MANFQDIPYRRIPGHSPLFLDYVDLSPGILRFFETPPVKQKLEAFARKQSSKKYFPRQEMAIILERQNALYGAGASLAEQIAELARPDSVAIVTGQQVGVFGGPLYTVYKALTAVALAQELRESGIRAVPVFWMETEDHDLAEATRVFRTDPSPGTVEVARTLFGRHALSPRPVGSLTLPLKIRDVNDDYVGSIPESPFRATVRALLEGAYAPGASMTLAFARLLRSILPGLLLFDPADPEAKRLAAPVFRKALENTDRIGATLRERAEELVQAGYPVQVRIRDDATLLFMVEGERRALERESERFRLRGFATSFTPEDLLRLTEGAPERFSPNVLLRPVVQDALFPTAAYVAGPSEIAYFAQLGPLYALMDRPMPVIWPRNGFTLLNPETTAELERLGIDPEACLAGRERMWKQAPPSSRELERLEELERRLDRDLRKIGAEIGAVEAGLERAAANSRSKILHNMGRMRARTRRLLPMDRAVDRLLARCRPDGKLQERGAGILPSLARYGSPLIERLRREARPENFAHRVLHLENSPPA